MNINYLYNSLSQNWVISELDLENEYLEFIGYNGEFLVSVMKHSHDNPSQPYFLSLSQLKGILERYEFYKLNWPEWFESTEEAISSALKLMDWIDLNYESFLPLTLEVLVSIGTTDQLNQLEKYFEGDLPVHDFQGDQLVFRKVALLQSGNSYAEAAILTIQHYAESLSIPVEEIKGGLLTNERFQLIENLRPKLTQQLTLVS